MMGEIQELFEPSEYLDIQGEGYFSILAKPSGRAKQDSYPLDMLPTVVRHVDPNIDTYISQATFSHKTRKAHFALAVGLLFVDLDTYKAPHLQGLCPEEQARKLVEYCQSEGIPAPSLVLFSGRGLQAKWFLSESLGKYSFADWNAAQLALVKAFEHFASDYKAKDISRVLRLDQTTNTKSGEKARIVYTSGVGDVLSHYDFRSLANLLTERYREEPREPNKKPQKTTQTTSRIITRARPGFTIQRLNWFRYNDIERLWNLRGGVPEGYREITLFWMLNFFLTADPVKASELWNEAQVIASSIDNRGGWWYRSDLTSLYSRAKRYRDEEGHSLIGGGKSSTYKATNQYLMDLFKITPEEERELKTIISRQERNRRRTEKRREAGVKPREEYEANSLARQKPWEKEGISRAWWYEKRKKGLL